MVLGVVAIGHFMREASDLLQCLLGIHQFDLGLTCLAFDSAVLESHGRNCTISWIPGAVVGNEIAQLRRYFFDGTGSMIGALSLTAIIGVFILQLPL